MSCSLMDRVSHTGTPTRPASYLDSTGGGAFRFVHDSRCVVRRALGTAERETPTAPEEAL